jgi:hypothetical protein
MEESEYNLSLAPNRIFLKIEKKIEIGKNDIVRKYDKFDIEVISPIYDLGLVAMEIASQEAKYCYFEYVGYSIIYPDFSFEKFAMSDSTKIYSIEHLPSKQKLNMATRGCAIPPGL